MERTNNNETDRDIGIVEGEISARNYELKYELSKLELPKYEDVVETEEEPWKCPNIDVTIRKNIFDQTSTEYLQKKNRDQLMKIKLLELENINKEESEDIKNFNLAESDEDLDYLYNNFNKLSTEITSLLNYIEFIETHINMNEENKKYKLVQFLSNFCQNYTTLTNEIKQTVCHHKLTSSIKDNIVKFFEIKYKLLLNYAIQSKKLEELINLSKLKLNNSEKNQEQQ